MRRGGGESYHDAAGRFQAACLRIAEAHPGERVLVVAHGAVIRLYLTLVLGMALDRTWHLMIANTGICRVRPFAAAFDGDRPLTGRVVMVNDTAHLDAMHQTAEAS
jgi:broad specificity phosphatase PhoE